MWIIWQELRAIMADAWSEIVSNRRWLMTGIADNYLLIIVAVVGFGSGLALMGGSLLGMLSTLFNPISEMVSFVTYVSTFGVGGGVMILTTNLFERVDKRMTGKPKDEDQPHPTSTESEAQ